MSPTSQPLTGRRIVLTRHSEANSRIGDRLRQLGAHVLDLPLIDVQPDIDAAAAHDVFAEFGHYEWLVFTSRNGVRYFMECFLKVYEDIRSLGFIRIAVVGKGTADALRAYHLKPDLMPENAVAEDLADAIKAEQSLDNLRVLVITGNRNREVLVERLEKELAIVDTLRVYRTDTPDLATHPVAAQFRDQGADAVVFASSSAVKSFGLQADHLRLGPTARVPVLCSFGPVTTQTMRDAGIPVAVQAAKSDVDSMVQALVDHFST
jgi:uroporphyrinogen-III synthase